MPFPVLTYSASVAGEAKRGLFIENQDLDNNPIKNVQTPLVALADLFNLSRISGERFWDHLDTAVGAKAQN
ncbi:hypothetical protein Tco_0809232 [Tanacetum coccineum]